MKKEKLDILIVEDNGMFLNIAEDMLDEHNVIAAMNYAEGLALYKKHTPDMVLLDISLPDRGRGRAVCGRHAVSNLVVRRWVCRADRDLCGPSGPDRRRGRGVVGHGAIGAADSACIVGSLSQPRRRGPARRYGTQLAQRSAQWRTGTE